MTIIEHGSIEILRGVGQNAISEGKVFVPEDAFDDIDPDEAVERLTGVTLGDEQHPADPPVTLIGQWAGVDADGKHCTVKAWVHPD